MTVEQDLREQRQSLAAAINARDLEAVQRFLHPSLVVKTIAGSTLSFRDLMSQFVTPMFNSKSDWGEEIEIESLAVNGDTAELTVRRSDWHSRWLIGLFGFKQTGTARSLEIWQFIDGSWQLTESQELEAASA